MIRSGVWRVRSVPMKKTSLRLKITVVVLLPLILVWSILAYVRYVNYQRLLLDNVRTSASNTGEIIEGSLRHAMLANDFDDLERIVRNIAQHTDVERLLLLDKSGRVLIAAAEQPIGDQMDLDDPTCQACHQYQAATRNESVILPIEGGEHTFRNVNAIENATACTSCHDPADAVLGVLITDFDISPIDRSLALDRRHSLMWSGGAVVLTLVVVDLLMGRVVVRRIEQLVCAIRRITTGELDVEVFSESGDEIGELTRSFNQMVGGLREKEALERSLVSRTEALQAQTERLSALNEIADTVSQSLDLERILDSALSKIAELIDVRASWVVLRNEQSEEFEFVAGRGLPDGLGRTHVLCTWNRSVCSEVFELGESKVLQDPLGHGCPMVEYFQREGLLSRVCVPLQSKDRVLGVMSLIENEMPDGAMRTQDTLDMLNAIGRQMGMAIENASLYTELRQEEELRRRLLKRVITVQEKERKRIALELHDQMGQILTSVIMNLSVLGEADSVAQFRDGLSDLREMAAQVLRQVHDLALELRPSVLDDLGLLPALRQLHKGFRDRFHLMIDFQVLGLDGQRLSSTIDTALYRIVQEALTNVARHAEAQSVSVLLEYRDDSVRLIVEDDGVGFDVATIVDAQARERLGLYGMRERAVLLGGTLTIESLPGTGTAIFVDIPLQTGEAESD
jgi:signal transduction histidine kinase